MKRIIALFLTLMLTLVCLTSYAGTLKVTSPDTKSGEPAGLSVGWEKHTDYFTMIATWSQDGDIWEAVVTGLPEKLTGEQVKLLISAALQGNQAVISGSALIDVEKFSNKIPLSYAELYAADKSDMQNGNWGDSNHCWAASVSDMLELTGWIKYTVEPDTKEEFDSADDLFGLFNRAFANEGCLHVDALDWVFTGSTLADIPELCDGVTGPLVTEYADQSEIVDIGIDYYDTIGEFNDALAEALPLLREGAAVGSSIMIQSNRYPLKDDPDILVTYDPARDAFLEDELIYADPEDVWPLLFVPDTVTGLPIPVIGDGEGHYYEAGSGDEVDEDEVWIADCVYDEETDQDYPVDPDSLADGDPYYIRYITHDISEVDLTGDGEPVALGGDIHAVTVMGYVMNRSEADPDEQIRAIILSDSDNDAAIYRPDENTLPREDRPDTYTLYPAKSVKVHQEKTVSIEGYMPYGPTLFNTVTALMPAPDPGRTPPGTGDNTPVALCAALLILSAGTTILLLRKKQKQ